MLRCSACSRHVKPSSRACPFCAAPLLSAPRARGKNGFAVAAGVAAMGVGLGCAYGLPPDYYERDASKPDVSVSDGSRDAIGDSPKDAPPDAPSLDAAPDGEGGTKDAALDAQDGGG